uniref:TBC1 domain family member 31 n=1 Tax=Petromyzon marinus TaxID=7757 RepID=A0AAJ7XAC9_PETMA|nr:TBC1 domain family member 31 isoform X1 [Petromyzon marinus]
MQSADLGSRERGLLWHRRAAPAADGSVLRVLRSVEGSHSRTVRFLHAAFDSTGEAFVAGDHQGHVYLLDLTRNSFRLVQRTGLACTALAFCLRRRSEFLVALSDYSIKCFDAETSELVSWMRGHNSAVSCISVHASGRLALTTSGDTAQLWDLDTFQRRRRLSLRNNDAVQKVFFLPMSNTIVSCFKDGSVFGWDGESLECRFQLPVPPTSARLAYRVFAATRDGRTLACGGRSGCVHVWALESRRLVSVLQMPPAVRAVRQLHYLSDAFDGGANQVLGVLAQDGVARFVHVGTTQLLFSLGSGSGSGDGALSSLVVCPAGRNVLGLGEDGAMTLYSVAALTHALKQPPPSLVRVVQESKSRGKAMPAGAAPPTRRVGSGKVRRPSRVRGEAVGTRADRGGGGHQHGEEQVEGQGEEVLDRRRLLALLKGFGEYPAKYRLFIWRALLRLPENHDVYNTLVEKGTHPAYGALHRHYPVRSHKLLRGLQRTLSALAHWAPIFGETEFLPLLAFPFVKLFQNNQLVCFEVLATVLVNWCSRWFEYFPNPPLNVLACVENALAHHDHQLLQHFVEHGVTAQVYAWPLLETLFSEVLTRDEWLRLFDWVLSRPPAFLPAVAAAYSSCARGALLRLTQLEDFQFFFHHRGGVDVGRLLREAQRLLDTAPQDAQPGPAAEEQFQPLPRGLYPVFNKYPESVVQFHARERDRICAQELEYLREKQVLHELAGEAERRRAVDEAWSQQQAELVLAEEGKRKQLQLEEQRLVEQRARLVAMRRELRVKELAMLDATRRRHEQQQLARRRTDLAALDHHIEHTTRLRDQETEAAIQEVEVRRLELETQRRLFELDLAKEHEAVDRLVRGELDMHRRRAGEEGVDETLTRSRTAMDSEKNTSAGQQAVHTSLATASGLAQDGAWRGELASRAAQGAAREEARAVLVEQGERAARHEQRQLLDAAQALHKNRWEEVRRRWEILEVEPPSHDHVAQLGPRDALLVAEESADHPMDYLGDIGRRVATSESLWDKHSPLPNRPPTCLNDPSRSDAALPQMRPHTGLASPGRAERDLLGDVRELRRRLAAQALAAPPTLARPAMYRT